MAVRSDGTLAAPGLAGHTNTHREVEHGVIVVAELPCGRQRFSDTPDPSLSARFRVVRLALQASEPARDVVVDDHCALAAMKAEPCGRGVRANTRESSELRRVLRRNAASGADASRRIEQQRPTPVKACPRRDFSSDLRSGRDQVGCAGKPGAQIKKDRLRLSGPRPMKQHFCHEGQPWI